MVLFEMLKNQSEVMVAHFDHGTRPSSGDDREFVQKVCSENKVKCIVGEARLGEGVSEEQARKARYAFLRQVAREQNGRIYTAHHQDDMVESAVINLMRGTGWRGLTPMGNDEIVRPLLTMSKKEILKYAAEHDVVFRQDPTNVEEKYLRNRVRVKMSELLVTQLVKMIEEQGELKTEIDGIITGILPGNGMYQRAWFKEMDEKAAMEILRAGLLRVNIRLTRPQLRDFLEAIREYAPGKKFNLPGDKLVRLEKNYFILK